ncbi:hypothetical protein FNF29_02597 [Cafeteria roenbergensis]|uniref:Regulator of microtubule dynamics protein 1 n=1 Tax=Cafeteria roenbergensis TaxID=33653 RepID=A0A5A8CPF0_CAFRO|nr:hypothetical protein FNF29_02597 [Cafeteria roenbergensis]KAA0159520.1 hypothetical protein FNF31_04759 [Cafeteria roenbergensis]|eukprot:KAA0154377.1 hypothetical protein FNF29_02597 [Cafeteria roenbergensis]
MASMPSTAGSSGRAGRDWASSAFVAGAAVAAAAVVAGSSEAHAFPGLASISVVDEMHSLPQLYSRQTVYDHLCELTATDYEMDDVMLQWRKARAAYELAMVAGTPAEKRQSLLREAYRIMKRCITLDRNNFEIHRWTGLIVVALAEFQTAAEQVNASFEASDEWRQAIEIEPSDAESQHLLGCWAYDQAAWSWWYRWYISAVYATPPDATWADARDSFAAAERIAPGAWKKNQLMLARTYEKLGETERAAQWAARALHGAIATPEDLKTHAAALELLKTLSPDRYQDAIDDGAQRALDDAEVPVPVEQRTDGFRGDPVPATVEGNTSAISRVRKLIE